MKHRFTVTMALLCFAIFARAQTSDHNAKLKEGLKRFPPEDANKDGVLTLKEAKAFKEIADQTGQKDGGGSDTKSSYIYKTVGRIELPLFVDIGKDVADPPDPDGKGNFLNHVKPGAPPTIIFHGTADITAPYATVEAFTAAMKMEGNRCELVGYEGEGHSFFHKGRGYKLTLAERDKFLTELGWIGK